MTEHCVAWRVDFNVGLNAFEPLVAGVRRVVDLAIGSPIPGGANILFISSIAVYASKLHSN